ncbi:MAG: hypothetical protein M9905_18795 [Rhizobiaceae bacterium]|nr:hypothetical protein [Rhizobiaceae bacterium]
MTLRVDYQCQSFPISYSLKSSGTLQINWDDLLWAAITIGRPSIYHVFQHGSSSFHEAIFRLSLIRMAVEQDWHGNLHRTTGFDSLDPTEKGMVSYFLGMTLCKLFSEKLLNTPWLLHLDVFKSQINTKLYGRSRPDLIGQNNTGQWCAFESKGRSSVPSYDDKLKAKKQAERIVEVDQVPCSLHIGSFAFFKSGILEFYWQDPEPISVEPLKLPGPAEEWRYYFEPALAFASIGDDSVLELERARADVAVTFHPKIRGLLDEAQWSAAREACKPLREDFKKDGYQSDGIMVTAGESWSRSARY